MFWRGTASAAGRHGVCDFTPPLAKLRKMVRYPITAMGTACVSVYRTFVLATGAHPQASGQQAGARRQPWACGAGTQEKTPCPYCRSSPLIFPDHLTQTPHQQQLQGDLSRVYYPIAAGVPRTPEERLQAGSRVEITGGALAGLKARSGGAASSGRLRESEFLQRGVAVASESWMSQSRSSLASLASARA